MDEYRKTGKIEQSALKAGMGRKAGGKYIREMKYPSELAKARSWRTRADPFDEVWPGMKKRLVDAPGLEAKTLFEDLLEREPDRFSAGQLRTLQRRVKEWRAKEGPDKEVFFAQQHVAGEAAQTDFTWATELGITIGGEPFVHMLCHFVLPFSNWEWATVCHSESLLSLRHGIQDAVFRLGRVPTFHQTDHSTAATHNPSKAEKGEKPKDEVGFNEEYLALMRHLGMQPRTTCVGAKEQNGDVEASNGTLKRRMEQHLLLRGSRDFGDLKEYEAWLAKALEKGNVRRSKRLKEELEAMRPLRVDRLVEYKELDIRVTSWSTIRVKRNAYSVPSRLIKERVRVRVFESRIEVYYGGVLQMTCDRVLGERSSRINYRHVIWSLVRKPGAFERYRYREDLYPSLTFRKAYDLLSQALPMRKASVEYLRTLHLAAKTMESKVEAALDTLLAKGELPLAERVKELVVPLKREVPEMEVLEVDLDEYDGLLLGEANQLAEVVA